MEYKNDDEKRGFYLLEKVISNIEGRVVHHPYHLFKNRTDLKEAFNLIKATDDKQINHESNILNELRSFNTDATRSTTLLVNIMTEYAVYFDPMNG